MDPQPDVIRQQIDQTRFPAVEIALAERRLEPDLPAMCDAIVQKLMSKDPGERYQSPQELLNYLYLHGASSGPTNLPVCRNFRS